MVAIVSVPFDAQQNASPTIRKSENPYLILGTGNPLSAFSFAMATWTPLLEIRGPGPVVLPEAAEVRRAAFVPGLFSKP